MNVIGPVGFQAPRFRAENHPVPHTSTLRTLGVRRINLVMEVLRDFIYAAITST